MRWLVNIALALACLTVGQHNLRWALTLRESLPALTSPLVPRQDADRACPERESDTDPFRTGLTFAAAGCWSQAAHQFALVEGAFEVAGQMHLARAWYALGETERAFDLWVSLDESGAVPDAVTWVLRSFAARGDWRAVQSLAQRALLRQPDRQALWVQLGDARAGLNDQRGALHAYLKAADLGPLLPETWFAAGRAALATDHAELERAVAELERISPGLALALRGLAMLEAGDPRSARELILAGMPQIPRHLRWIGDEMRLYLVTLFATACDQTAVGAQLAALERDNPILLSNHRRAFPAFGQLPPECQ